MTGASKVETATTDVATNALPIGWRVGLDPTTRQVDENTLLHAGRVLRLSPAGVAALGELRSGPVTSPAAARLGRRLVDAGHAYPIPGRGETDGITVVIPVRDRAASLRRCLASIGAVIPVVVIDDGSRDARAIATVTSEHGALLVRLDVSGGPGPARDAGLAHVHTPFVAFVDSDCVVPAGWLETLTGHFSDPGVAAVAPRIVGAPSTATPAKYGAVRGALDMGAVAGLVGPSSPVRYVPTATLVARVGDLEQLQVDGAVFDVALRYGEDVDLVWRLVRSGRRVHYDPRVNVRHEEPQSWGALLGRRFRYGTSAGPLARRHGTTMAPLALWARPATAVAFAVAGRRIPAAIAAAATVQAAARAQRAANLPRGEVPRVSLTVLSGTATGIARWATAFAAPALALAGAKGGRRTRAIIAATLVGPPLAEWATTRPRLDPLRWVVARTADDVSYGAGVWRGAIAARTLRPILPTIRRPAGRRKDNA